MRDTEIGYELRELLYQQRAIPSRWASRRHVYRYHNFDPSLPIKHIGVFVLGQLASVVSVEPTGEGEYLISVTSPPRSNLEIVANATYHVGWQLFDQLGTRRLYTMSPTIRGHVHIGSRRLCEMCGLTFTGYTETDEHGMLWAEYELTRANWLKFHQVAAA